MQQFMNEHYKLMLDLSIKIMGHIAISMNMPVNSFDHWFINDSLSTLRLIHYNPREK